MQPLKKSERVSASRSSMTSAAHFCRPALPPNMRGANRPSLRGKWNRPAARLRRMARRWTGCAPSIIRSIPRRSSTSPRLKRSVLQSAKALFRLRWQNRPAPVPLRRWTPAAARSAKTSSLMACRDSNLARHSSARSRAPVIPRFPLPWRTAFLPCFCHANDV